MATKFFQNNINHLHQLNDVEDVFFTEKRVRKYRDPESIAERIHGRKKLSKTLRSKYQFRITNLWV